MTRRLYIETVGCQMNVLDSEMVVADLRKRGYELERETNYVYHSDVDCYNKDLFFKAKARGAR